MDQQNHHSFVDLDNHDSQTDAEALEAIRVAIGQSADFNDQPLSDVLNNHDHDHEEQEQDEGVLEHEAGGSGVAASSSGGNTAQLERCVNELLEASQASLWEIETTNAPVSGETWLRIQGNGKKQIRLIKNILELVKQQPQPQQSFIDPSLSGYHVLKSDYDALKAKYDALYAGSDNGGARKIRKRVRPSTSQADLRADSEMERDASATPVDEKSRKKRSMKLEHLIHQQANMRLGIEYNVSKFESKGSRELPDPESTPPGIMESANMVQEFRPDFTADAKALTVRPFLKQVGDDVIEEWEAGVSHGEPKVTHEKIREAVEVYWVRLQKRWNEQCIRAVGGVHKDELVRRKQNQYRRQQSLVARRLAAFDQSPLNACKLRSLYRTLLTLDFAAKTVERPCQNRRYTDEEWHAYRKSQYGTQAEAAHEVLDQFWLSSTARSILCLLDVSATDQSIRLKRKGKPKGPAPGFHLPPDMWDHSVLPTLRPKDSEGLPIPGAQGLFLFRFQVDEKVAAENAMWAEGLYDNPPIPETDTLLPSLQEVMAGNVFQHLRPIVKLVRDFHNPRHLTPQEVEAINAQPVEEIVPTIQPINDAFAAAMPLQEIDLDISLDTLVNMTDNQYMVSGSLDSQLANLEASNSGVGVGTPSKPILGTSVHARKMGKRSSLLPPGGAAMPVPKRFKADPETMGLHSQPENELGEDAGFLEDL